MLSSSSALEGLDQLTKSTSVEKSSGINEHGGHNSGNQLVTATTILEDQEQEHNIIKMASDGESQTHSGDNWLVTPVKRASIRRLSVSTRGTLPQEGDESRRSQQQRSHQNKEETGSCLRLKFQEIIESARYELVVDAYRGIFSDKICRDYYSACFRTAGDCICSRETMTEENKPAHGLHDDSRVSCNDGACNGASRFEEDVIGDNFAKVGRACNLKRDPYHGICCPSVRSWIDAQKSKSKQTSQLAAVHKKRRKNDNKKRGSSNNDGASNNLAVIVLKGEYHRNETSYDDNQVVRRKMHPSDELTCDTNPLCLFSLGGVIKTCLQNAWESDQYWCDNTPRA